MHWSYCSLALSRRYMLLNMRKQHHPPHPLPSPHLHTPTPPPPTHPQKNFPWHIAIGNVKYGIGNVGHFCFMPQRVKYKHLKLLSARRSKNQQKVTACTGIVNSTHFILIKSGVRQNTSEEEKGSTFIDMDAINTFLGGNENDLIHKNESKNERP